MTASNRGASAFLLAIVAASAQVRTIYIPAGGGGGVQRPAVRVQGPLTVKSGGVTHTITDAEITGARGVGAEGLDALGLGDDVAGVVAFRVGAHSVSYEQREQKKVNFFRAVFPIGNVERVAVATGECQGNKALTVTLRSGPPVPLKLCEDSSSFWFHISGKEDLKEFGKADFRGSFSEITEIALPAAGLAAIPSRSSISATVTEVSGRVHELSDVRMKDNKLRLDRGGSAVEVSIANVTKIALRKDSRCTVTLKSGAQQDFTCSGADVGGKVQEGWYELVPQESLKSVEFR